MTALFLIRYGFVARNVLRTATLTGLKAAGVRVVVAAPAAGERYFQQEAADRGFELRPFPGIRSSRRERVFDAVTNTLLFDHPGTTRTMGVKWRRLPEEGHWGAFVAKALVSPLRLQHARSLRAAAERADAAWFHHPEVTALLDDVQPSLVVSTDLFASEAHVVREARRRRVPTVCLVKSWDNLTSKSRIRVEPDYYSVWSPLMKEEIQRLHFVDPRRVFVSGAPNFDLFASPSFKVPSREAFCRSLGFEPHRKLVVYSPGNKLTYSDDNNIRRIHGVLQELEGQHPFHLHIRKYPKSRQTFDHLSLSNLSVGEAGVVVDAWADQVDQPLEFQEFLGHLMYHADLLVHIGSTVAVDAACFDTPIIGYGLDAAAGGSRWHYAPFIYELTHNRYLTDAGGQRVVRSLDELRAAVRAYFENPALDREGRARMVRTITGGFDGRAGERISGFLLGVLRGRGDRALDGSLDAAPATR
jgi:hypothetical protein